MESSKVYFTDMRCVADVGLVDKMDKLITRAGIDEIDFEKKFVAIKLSFGEPGNLSFLRPNFAKKLANHIQAKGGLPFLTDCNTLYPGRRKHALEHLDAAMENGYFPLSTSCQMIIGDGLKGTDDVEVALEGTEYCKEAYIGTAIMDADIFISLTHFKGHEATGFGGALKNIGMGCGSRRGKMAMHKSGKPQVEEKDCRMCGQCKKSCGQDAIWYDEHKKAHIDIEKCVGCGRCIGACNFDAIVNIDDAENDILNAKIAEYTKAVLQDRPNFHISVVNQVSPFCDCHAENDAAVVPDIGIFASFDPVALDKACIDAVNAANPIQSSIWGDVEHNKQDIFTDIHPTTNWKEQITHAEKIKLGNGNYELITIK